MAGLRCAAAEDFRARGVWVCILGNMSFDGKIHVGILTGQ